MVSNRDRLPDIVQRELDACAARGVRWHIKYGSRHRHLYVAAQLVGVLHFGTAKATGHGAAYYNIIAAIRRRLSEVAGGQE